MKSIVVPYLRSKGFKGSFPHFRRQGELKVDVLGFQFSQFGAGFYFEIDACPLEGITRSDGIHRSAASIKYYQCHKRARIGEDPFNFENGGDEDIAFKVVEYLKEAEEM